MVGALCQPSSSCPSMSSGAQAQGTLGLLSTGWTVLSQLSLAFDLAAEVGDSLSNCRLEAHLCLRLALSSRKWPAPGLVQLLVVLGPKAHTVANGVH